MVLTKRERYVGIVTGAVLAILVLDQFILTPTMKRTEELDAKIELAQQEHLRAQQLFSASRRASREWNQIAGEAMSRSAGGDPESLVLNNVRQWAQDEGMRLPSVIPQPAQVEKGFNKIVLRATGSGSMSQVGRFLYRVQTATMPVRITDLQINSAKEGTDELSVTFGIATISPAATPESERNGRPAATPAAAAPVGREPS